MLVIQKEKIEYPEKILFEHERLVVSSNKIIAIVGANGTGKTTFLNKIASANAEAIFFWLFVKWC